MKSQDAVVKLKEASPEFYQPEGGVEMSQMDIEARKKSPCGVCGVLHPALETHECNPSVLRGIDAANTKRWNEDLEPDLRNPPELHRTEAFRLNEGMKIIEDEEDQP